jgi:hypothetical protein
MLSEDKHSFIQRCRQIAEKLEHAATLHPRELLEEIDQIERELVGVRDDLILHCREQNGAAGPMRAKLEQLNVALSLVVAVEYPVTSIQRSALKQSHEVLRNC